jgi:Cd2+/Zn2+-exporting ATPase
VRSSFRSRGICCASEARIIREILQKLDGITKIAVNPSLKQVLVDHDPSVLGAAVIAQTLTNEDFPTVIVEDGEQQELATTTTNSSSSKGRSKFQVLSGICCASEIPVVKGILEPIDGIDGVMVHAATKIAYVDHDTGIISAETIANTLTDSGFETKIQQDFSKDKQAVSSFVLSKLSIAPTDSKTMVSDLKTFLETYEKNIVESYQVVKKSMAIDILHNPLLVSAESLRLSILEATQLQTTVEEDGNDGKLWEFAASNALESADEEEADGSEDDVGVGLRPAVAICGVLWIVSMLSNLGGNWEILSYWGLLSVGFGMPPIAQKAYKTARRGNIDTNVLMSLAILGAVFLGEYDEAAAVTFLFSLSEWLEDKATHRANVALKAIVHLKPETANLIHPKTHELILVPATVVPVGALVAVKTGDKIPCDGVVVEGTSTVDESSLTGESRPVLKAPKDEVSGGTLNNGNTQLVVKTTQTSDDSAVSRLIRLVEEAQANRSETEKIVDSFAKVYTPVVVLSALTMCTLSWLWGPVVGKDWTSKGLSLIVIACPCALVISTPISYVAGLAATAQNGILVKGGAYLEALGQLQHVCFDKTGTLTAGDFHLLKLVVAHPERRQEILKYLALMEARATHPLAKSLVDGIQAEGVSIPKTLKIQDHTFLPGEGVKGIIQDKEVYVGNERLFRRLNLWKTLPTDWNEQVKSWESMGGTIGFLSIQGEGIVCGYCVADAPRPETRGVLKDLKKMGLTVTMLTGDKRDTALAIGKTIGLEEANIQSELLPEEKLAFVQDLKNHEGVSNPLLALFVSEPRLVLMCGDGVNDAPSLAASDVGVAMGAGAALAMETADVTLMDSHLTKLLYSINMGRKVIQTIRQNVVFSILVKLLVLGLTLTDRVGLWAAIGSDVGSMILVTLNGMSLLPRKTNKQSGETGLYVI